MDDHTSPSPLDLPAGYWLETLEPRVNEAVPQGLMWLVLHGPAGEISRYSFHPDFPDVLLTAVQYLTREAWRSVPVTTEDSTPRRGSN